MSRPLLSHERIDRAFVDTVAAWKDVSGAVRGEDEPVCEGTTLRVSDARELFASMVASRQIDLCARRLRQEGKGFYTIGSAGHEANAVLGRVTETTDPALLHYRSGAFLLERARRAPKGDPILDMLLGFVASSDDPVSGGRHKIVGSVPLNVWPQTSTIASHLPKAVGAAFALERAHRLGVEAAAPDDAIVVCSFGDASVNHAVAQTAFNAASWVAHQRLPLPILFVCEDNGIGISVKTPTGWIEDAFSRRPHLSYRKADGSDLAACWEASLDAVALCRERRVPVFLHLSCVRLMGHAGSDVETEYRSAEAIARDEARDPLLAVARQIVDAGVLTTAGILDLYRRTGEEVARKAEEACARPKLTEAAAIAAPLKPPAPVPIAKEANRPAPDAARVRVFGSREALPEREGKPLTMAALLSRSLADLGAKYPEMIVFGEDVADKGGVYHVTADLKRRLGAARVFDTLLDETTILGLAIGSAQMGLLPLPEIQYLAYLHNAEDQLRGEACSLGYFSNGQLANPMVIRIAALAYQEGFGGHFHNDNAIGVLRDIPGLIVACPARGEDAVGMIRTCVALAKTARKVVVFLEPIALYHQKDLLEKGDGKWLDAYPAPGTSVPFGEGRVYHPGAKDLAILTYGNGVRLSLQAAADLKAKHQIAARVVDLRWLLPLPGAFLRAQAKTCRAVLLVDECRRTGSPSEEIVALLQEDPATRSLPVARVTADDTYIPLGDAMKRVIPSREGIVEAASRIVWPPAVS